MFQINVFVSGARNIHQRNHAVRQAAALVGIHHLKKIKEDRDKTIFFQSYLCVYYFGHDYYYFYDVFVVKREVSQDKEY